MTEYNYNQQMNIKYDHLELIDVPAIVAENKKIGSTKHLRR